MADGFVKIPARSIVGRINRILQRTGGGMLRKVHFKSKAYASLGPYYIAPSSGPLRDVAIDLDALARRMGVLKDHERIGGV